MVHHYLPDGADIRVACCDITACSTRQDAQASMGHPHKRHADGSRGRHADCLMQTNQLIAGYRTAIEAMRVETVKAVDARITLDSWQSKLKLCEAEVLLNSAGEGKNAEERAARLLMSSTLSEECQSVRASIVQARRNVAETDGRLCSAREACRLLRLELALTVAPSLLEAVA
jgi:hypothetical protein